jgi:predicted nucleic acid-binding protein
MTASGSVLLDTTIVVEHLRGTTPSIGQRFKETNTIYLPLTALGELFYGAYNSTFESKGLE